MSFGFQVQSQTPYVHQGAHVMWATPPCAPWLGYPEPACEKSCLARTRLKTGPSLIPHGIAYCLRVRRQKSLTGSAKSPHTGAAPRQTPRRPLDTAGLDANARSCNDGNATRPPPATKNASQPTNSSSPPALVPPPRAPPRTSPECACAERAGRLARALECERAGVARRRRAPARSGAERNRGRWRAG